MNFFRILFRKSFEKPLNSSGITRQYVVFASFLLRIRASRQEQFCSLLKVSMGYPYTDSIDTIKARKTYLGFVAQTLTRNSAETFRKLIPSEVELYFWFYIGPL